MNIFEYFKNSLPEVKKTVFRFPITSIFCVLSTVLWIVIIEKKNFEEVQNLFYTFILGTFLFVVIFQLSEHFQSLSKKILIVLIGLVLLGLYFISIDIEIESIRFSLLLFSIIVLIPVCSLNKNATTQDLWFHFTSSIKNFFISMSFSNIMCLGVFLAFWVVEKLFGIIYIKHLYTHTWFIFAGLYAPILFLSRLPLPGEPFKAEIKYTIENWFIKFILVPLSVAYFVILYIYFGKVIITWDWPK
ncbi:MAG: DUF4153 domain-containing protein, partial [Alphaproteobacteria bacterium]|nr:DUF4153 domain-containing protein [Alphaproteobacteria bacterium]